MLITLIKGTDSGATWPGFPSHLQYLLAELSWDSHLTSLSLSCLINKMVTITVPASKGQREESGKQCLWSNLLTSSTQSASVCEIHTHVLPSFNSLRVPVKLEVSLPLWLGRLSVIT